MTASREGRDSRCPHRGAPQGPTNTFFRPAEFCRHRTSAKSPCRENCRTCQRFIWHRQFCTLRNIESFFPAGLFKERRTPATSDRLHFFSWTPHGRREVAKWHRHKRPQRAEPKGKPARGWSGLVSVLEHGRKSRLSPQECRKGIAHTRLSAEIADPQSYGLHDRPNPLAWVLAVFLLGSALCRRCRMSRGSRRATFRMVRESLGTRDEPRTRKRPTLRRDNSAASRGQGESEATAAATRGATRTGGHGPAPEGERITSKSPSAPGRERPSTTPIGSTRKPKGADPICLPEGQLNAGRPSKEEGNKRGPPTRKSPRKRDPQR